MNNTIGSVCRRFSSGKSIKADKISNKGLFPVYGGNGLRGYTDTYNFEGECAIVGRQGANCGNVRYFSGKAYMTEHAIVGCANDENCTGFLAYKLSMMNLGQYQGQSAQPGLSVRTLKKVPIQIPDKETQEKIFNLLKSIDNKIENNNKIITELDEMGKFIYNYWFNQFEFPNKEGQPYKLNGGDFIWNDKLKRNIPKGWKVHSVKDCVEHIKTGLNPRDNFKLGNGCIKYVTVKNLMTNGTINFSDCDLIDETAKQIIHNRSDVLKGDILFASIAPLGRCAIVHENPDEWEINESVFSIRPDLSMISCEFLYMFFMSEYFIRKAENNSTGSVFNGIRINTLEDIPILIPEKEIMELFDYRIKKLLYIKHKNERENQELSSLRDFLLPLLINGRIGFEEE